MSIASQAELISAVTNYLGRSDLTSIVPDCITLFEAAANRRLRVRQMELATTLTPSSGAASLPSDFLAWKRLTWTGTPGMELEYVHPDWLRAAYPASATGVPRVFTIEASSLIVRPSSDTNLSLLYWQEIPALSAGANWLILAHPDLYLWGALCEAWSFVPNIEKAALCKARRDEAFDEIERLDQKHRGPSAIRPMGPVI